LKEAGFVEGENLSILYRGADDHYDRLPALAAELVSQSVAVIATAGGPVAALAAKSATNSIPIVFAAVSDPVKSGLVASLNRPGSNVTGNAGLTIELDAKRLELLSELSPAAQIIGALINANRPGVEAEEHDLLTAAKSMDRDLLVIRSSDGRLRRLSINSPTATFAEFSSVQMRYLMITVSRWFRWRHATPWPASILGANTSLQAGSPVMEPICQRDIVCRDFMSDDF
jgi:hypothetical protein